LCAATQSNVVGDTCHDYMGSNGARVIPTAADEPIVTQYVLLVLSASSCTTSMDSKC
jgi:hypothetical protein